MEETFGIIEGQPKPGLFGSSLTWILELLPYLKKHNIRPNWNIDTVCYGQLFPSILKAKNVNVTSDTIVKLSVLKKKHEYFFKASEWQLAHDLFFDYFDIADDILDSVESVRAKFGQKTLGVHFRGTDKLGSEATVISREQVVKHIDGFLSTHNEYDTIFVATDESVFISLMTQAFSEKYKLIFTNALRSTNKKPIHGSTSGCEQAKEAMVDSLALSKCDFVIKTSSCLSDWVKIWNPTIDVYNLNKFKENWFPQGMIMVKSFIV
jgi:hypothetical protein